MNFDEERWDAWFPNDLEGPADDVVVSVDEEEEED
jgi:hypothetical protein